MPPRLDVARELALHEGLRALIRAGRLRSAHDCAEGGLAVALAECCVSGPEQLGAVVGLNDFDGRPDILLFNESQSRAIVSVSADEAESVCAEVTALGVPCVRIGSVGGETLSISTVSVHCEWPIPLLRETWHDSIGIIMSGTQ